ncbi:MAG: hypothetical protein F6K19_15550 [Cyanothece sp. SIO1E1]|nr:hypothetical protein [Cyanothece sp. SIO1E1]
MSTRKLIRAIQSLLGQSFKLIGAITKRFMTWLLRILMIGNRPTRWSNAGFVLPTVVMVTLVVTLLVTTIMIRSFDRTKNARNVRVDAVTLEAAAPAIERAQAKLETLFQDPRLPRSTPSEAALNTLLSTDDNRYTLSDEDRLTLAFDFGDGSGTLTPNNTIDTSSTILQQQETASTAWRFPVDTDNNGLFDSFTLYGILLRSPERAANGGFAGPRTPLDARTPPQDESIAAGACAGALSTSANLVTEAGWFRAGEELRKSFYAYTATVPITNITELGLGSDYENYTGTAGFSALEYQQDRARIPIVNNAVVFEDDLAIVSGTNLFLNGSVVTNSNLFLSSSNNSAEVRLYQVSSPKSCFYNEDNAKVTVGGNIINAPPLATSYPNNKAPLVHLFITEQAPDQNPTVTTANQSVTTAEIPQNTLYNSQAYAARISHLVDTWVTANAGLPSANDPQIIQEVVNTEPDASKKLAKRIEALENYFRDRTRRVSFEEVPPGTNETFASPADDPRGTGDSLRPPQDWMFPVNPTNGQSAAGFAGITLNISGTNVNPAATEPDTLAEDLQENSIGDRILLGNNLPATWYLINNYAAYNTDDSGLWVQTDQPQTIAGTTWNRDETQPTNSTRARFTRVQSLTDVGDTARDGFWEEQAATAPLNLLDSNGGLRVVTGAGVYERKHSFLPPPTYDDPSTTVVENNSTYDDPLTTTVTEQFPLAWPDTMPMSPGLASRVYDNLPSSSDFGTWVDLPSTLPTVTGTTTIDPNSRQFAKGDLRMRATAVYHYARDAYDPLNGDNFQAPIACVSNYYDSTNSTTAANGAATGADDVAKSNNGVSYLRPTTTAAGLSGVVAPTAATGLFPGNEDSITLLGRLYYQANLVFPTGRFVNEPLRNALTTLASGGTLSLSEQSSIDSTVCALQILDGTISASTSVIANDTIREIAFLDARQIEAIDADDRSTSKVESFSQADLTGDYTLEISERQPLETRVTQLDLDRLRRQAISFTTGINGPTPEYLLPNSGIIYASRDDALPDLSAPLPNNPTSIDKATQALISPVDYRLDPTRRPSGIMLFNGKKLARNNSETFREAEKGLIVVSNLPAYVWGWADENQDGIAEESIFNPHSEEEFTADLNLPSWNNFYGRNTLEENFACRPDDARLPNCSNGDTWRPAVVIADAMNLLSRSFQFGFRNDGDYDLRNNNSGNQNFIENRLRNGFPNNNYVTSRDFNDLRYSAGNGYNNANDGSSYFNNFVTPVQRRVTTRAYVMEICRKLPVSACQPSDWVVGFDADGDGSLTTAEQNVTANQLGANLIASGITDNNSNGILLNNEVGWNTAYSTSGNSKSPLERLGGGSTTTPALVTADQRYPRRVAFARNEFLALAFTEIGSNAAAKPMGVGCPLDSTGNTPENNGCEYPNSGTRQVGIHVGINSTNALWFRTTDNTNGVPDEPTDITYDRTRPLYYEPPPVDGGKLILPDTQCFTNSSIVDCGTTQVDGTVNLNLPTTDKASDYILCMDANGANGGFARLQFTADASDLGAGITCNTPPRDAIDDAIGGGGASGLTQFTDNVSVGNGWTENGLGGSNARITGGTLSAEGPVTVYDIPTRTFQSGITISLDANGQTRPIFVLRGNNLTFNGAGDDGCSANCGIQLELNGVNPNDVFWLANGIDTVDADAARPHRLAGNFLGSNAAPSLGEFTEIRGGRFLGYTQAPNFPTNSTFIAVTADGQPLLAPVLQLQTARGNSFGAGANVSSTRWQQPAENTTFNLVTAVGNTPARPGEPDGGVANFLRLLEDWDNVNARVAGSLMEFDRSAYATAPFQPLLTTFNTNGGIFNYLQSYRTGNSSGRIPFLEPPNRLFGFDVGLLSQLPDLFSSRFTLPSPGAPNEFFREMNRGDMWIQTLLCAKTTTGNNNAINGDQRPATFCNTRSSDLP